jgi:hypothetical protein
MKTELYGWRLSGGLKSGLEREARLRKVPVCSVLDLAVREWLKKSNADIAGAEAQRELHFVAGRCLGVLGSGNSGRAENTRKIRVIGTALLISPIPRLCIWRDANLSAQSSPRITRISQPTASKGNANSGLFRPKDPSRFLLQLLARTQIEGSGQD